MKKLLISLFLGCTLLVPAYGYAIDLGTNKVHDAAEKAEFTRATENTLAETVGRIVRVALSMVGIIFTALMVYAGYLWMTAQGKDERVEKSKEIIKASIIGLIITMAAYAIADFVVPAILDATAGTPSTPPTP